ncbi:MAG: phosphotransferase, partial [Treponema sp.]|nr:phosphotransferase [Treponema sp.]
LHQTDFSGCPLKSKSSGLVTDPVYTALIHGDYCLPNIMLDNFTFTGLVDLDYAGIGDPHRDISSALWTLNHNLKTDKYNDLFIDCYGREKIDFKRLKLWEGL